MHLIEFLARAPGVNVTWNATELDDYVILSEQIFEPLPFVEVADHALDAIEYYCFKKVFSMSIRRFLLFPDKYSS